MKLSSVVLAMLLSGPLAAQTQGQQQPAPEKQRIAFRASSQNTKYTQQHILDVGDLPGHQVRLLEVHRTFPATAAGNNAQPAAAKTNAGASNVPDAPTFNGIRAKEQWTQGVSDYVNGSGRVFGYTTIILENGDKVYARYEGTNQVSNGRGNSLYVITIDGGTGQFKNVRGTMRGTGVLTFSEGKVTSNDVQYEGEYWTER